MRALSNSRKALENTRPRVLPVDQLDGTFRDLPDPALDLANPFFRRVAFRGRIEAGNDVVSKACSLVERQRQRLFSQFLLRHISIISKGSRPSQEGVVVWHDRGRDVRLFVPGKAPVLFDGKQPDHSFDTPLRIYREGLLCRTNYSGVAWIPLKDGDPEYLRRHGVLVWEEDKKQNCDFEGDCIAGGGQVVYTRRSRTKMNSPGEPATVLYDLPAKREIWTAKGWPIGLDGTHVIQTPHDWGYAVTELWRRRREGQGEGERLVLPWKTILILDFQAPHLLALFYGEGGPLAGRLDVETWSYREFDWTPSNKEHPQRRFRCLSDALYIGHHPVGGDARTGVLVVATGGAIYRVPWRGDAKTLPLKWSPGELK